MKIHLLNKSRDTLRVSLVYFFSSLIFCCRLLCFFKNKIKITIGGFFCFVLDLASVFFDNIVILLLRVSVFWSLRITGEVGTLAIVIRSFFCFVFDLSSEFVDNERQSVWLRALRIVSC